MPLFVCINKLHKVDCCRCSRRKKAPARFDIIWRESRSSVVGPAAAAERGHCDRNQRLLPLSLTPLEWAHNGVLLICARGRPPPHGPSPHRNLLPSLYSGPQHRAHRLFLTRRCLSTQTVIIGTSAALNVLHPLSIIAVTLFNAPRRTLIKLISPINTIQANK